MVGFVSCSGHRRSGRRNPLLIRGVVALAALFAFLVIRNAPPHFVRQLSLHHSSIKTVFNHGPKPHFDFDRLPWSAPVKSFLPFTPAAESSDLSPTAQVLSGLQAKGFHYNRPPPIS